MMERPAQSNTIDTQPLLHQDREDYSARQDSDQSRDRSFAASLRAQTLRFLTSKLGHYAVIFLVSIDVGCIFADFMISLYLCERECGKESSNYKGLHEVQEALSIVSLIFSCLFLVELMASIWAFGWRFFTSWFHCLDATVIVAGFILDVVLKGTLQEVGATVVVLRLWRVFKIIEEFSTGASERMEALNERIQDLEKENKELRDEVISIKNDLGREGHEELQSASRF